MVYAWVSVSPIWSTWHSVCDLYSVAHVRDSMMMQEADNYIACIQLLLNAAVPDSPDLTSIGSKTANLGTLVCLPTSFFIPRLLSHHKHILIYTSFGPFHRPPTIHKFTHTTNLSLQNAIALTLSSGTRAFAPASFNSLFAISIGSQLLSGYLAWFTMASIALVGTVVVFWKVEDIEGEGSKRHKSHDYARRD